MSLDFSEDDFYELNDKEKLVISSCMLRAGYSSSQLSKLTGINAREVKKILNKLIAENTLFRRTYINVYPLGYVFSGLYIVLNKKGQKIHKDISEYLNKNKFVSYLACFDDGKTMKVTTVSKSSSRVHELLYELSSVFGSVLSDRSLYELDRIYDYPIILSDKYKSDDMYLTFGTGEFEAEIDDLDKKILQLLTVFDADNLKDMSMKLSIPPSTLNYRIERLKNNGIINGERYVLNFDKLKMRAYIHLVTASKRSKDIDEKMREYVRSEPYLYYMANNIGAWDYEIGSVSSNSKDVQITEEKMRAFFKDEGVKINTYGIENLYKVSNYPFLTS